MDGRRTAAVLAIVAGLALVGCDSGATSGSGTGLPNVAYGTPIEPGPMPDPASCHDILAAEGAAAVRIRAGLGVPGLAAAEAAAQAAAADPAADVATFGIPLTRAELQLIRTSGQGVDDGGPISAWVHTGAPDRFGGMWFDGTPQVTVVNGDPRTLALARCVEVPATHYYWANVSYADGSALTDRIGRDWGRWRAAGVQLNVIYFDEQMGVEKVGVTVVDPAVEAQFRAEYGPIVQLVAVPPGQRL